MRQVPVSLFRLRLISFKLIQFPGDPGIGPVKKKNDFYIFEAIKHGGCTYP
jgi:hypothetical protein